MSRRLQSPALASAKQKQTGVKKTKEWRGSSHIWTIICVLCRNVLQSVSIIVVHLTVNEQSVKRQNIYFPKQFGALKGRLAVCSEDWHTRQSPSPIRTVCRDAMLSQLCCVHC